MRPIRKCKSAATEARGGKGARPVQYTVRNIPHQADRALRRKAAAEGKSLNEVLRQAIVKESGVAGETGKIYHDLDGLPGTWIEDPGFDAAIAAQDKVDRSLWR